LSVSTYEDRLANLERKVASLELRRLYEKSREEQNMPLELGRNLQEINENMTMLLGPVGAQGLDIRELKEQVQSINQRLDGMDRRFDSIDQRLDGMDRRFDTLTSSMDEKFNQVLGMLATLAARIDKQ
jgi:chromosome segregation ATPase